MPVHHMIDMEGLRGSLSQKAVDFVARQHTQSVLELVEDMGKRDSAFWETLESEFGAAEEEDAAGIVCAIFEIFLHVDEEKYDAYSVILISAVEHRAPMMVIEVIVQLCPYTVRYRHLESGTTIVHVALMHHHSKAMIEILSQGEDNMIQIVDSLGLSVLHYAAMYHAPLDVVRYLYELDPTLTEFRSDNMATIEVQSAMIGQRQSDGCPVFYNHGEVSTCPGRSTPLCVALFQNRNKQCLIDNGDVIEFLDEKSVTAKLIPDCNHELPFMILLEGWYSAETFKRLLIAFCISHARDARMIAFCANARGERLLQTAVRLGLKADCVQILCEFIMEQYTNLNATVKTIYAMGSSIDQHRMGIGFQSDPIEFDTEGVMSSVIGSRTVAWEPVASPHTQLVTQYTPVTKVMLSREETLYWCLNMAHWINPLNETKHINETQVLGYFIQYLTDWFTDLLHTLCQNAQCERCFNQICTYLKNVIVQHDIKREKMAQENEYAQQKHSLDLQNSLIAEEAAEAAVKSAKQMRGSRKSRRAHNRGMAVNGNVSMAHENDLIHKIQIMTQQHEQEHKPHESDDSQMVSVNGQAEEAGMDIPISRAASPILSESAHTNAYERQLLEKAQAECVSQAQMLQLIQSCHAGRYEAGIANQEEDTGRAASSAFIPQRFQQEQQIELDRNFAATTLPNCLSGFGNAIENPESDKAKRVSSESKKRRKQKKEKQRKNQGMDAMDQHIFSQIVLPLLQTDVAGSIHGIPESRCQTPESQYLNVDDERDLDDFETSVLNSWLEVAEVEDTVIPSHQNEIKCDNIMSKSGWRLDADLALRFATAVKIANEQTGASSSAIFEDGGEIQEDECMFCISNVIHTRFEPCMHKCYCSDCVNLPITIMQLEAKTMKCPLCNHSVTKITPI